MARANNLAIGIEGFRTLGDALAVQLGIDLHAGGADPDNAFHDVENVLAQLGLDLAAAFIHQHGAGRLAIAAAGQLASTIIGDRNAGRIDARA